MVTVLGFDEAGRGPVIGPLVMAGVLIDEEDTERLQRMGVKDSKLIAPLKRERMFDILKDTVKDHRIVIVSPEEIDHALSDDSALNLNWLEAEKQIAVINELKPDKVIIDCPSTNVLAYTSYVRERLENPNVVLICEHKADHKYPVAGAASILAKVTRDKEISFIKQRVGHDFGSGYIADERTASFIKTHWNKHPEIFRKSWAPYKKLVQAANQTGLGSFVK